MSRKSFVPALACAALLVAAPALAHGGGKSAAKGESRGHGGSSAKSRHAAPAVSNGQAHRRSDTTEERTSSANAERGGAGTVVADGRLAGLTAGMTVLDPAGAPVGVVERIKLARNGTVRMVLVRSVNGRRIIPLSPDRLNLSAGTLTTDSVKPGLGRGR